MMEEKRFSNFQSAASFAQSKSQELGRSVKLKRSGSDFAVVFDKCIPNDAQKNAFTKTLNADGASNDDNLSANQEPLRGEYFQFNKPYTAPFPGHCISCGAPTSQGFCPNKCGE